MSGPFSRVHSYAKRVRHEVAMWQWRRSTKRSSRRYEQWLQTIERDRPEVLIGADLPYGGVRNHIRAIRAYSSLRVAVVPDEEAMRGLDNFRENIRQRFHSYSPPGDPVVHSHVMPWFIAWCRERQRTGLRWVHTYHNNYFPEHGRGELLPWQQEINHALLNEAPHADVRLSVARWQQAELREEHGIETLFVPNGVDVALCDRGNARRFRVRIDIDEPFVLYVGRNDPVKDPAEFVRLARCIPQQRFVMIGGGLCAETLLKEWNVEVPPNLRVLGGVPHETVQDALAACAALVVTSKREGLPTLVLEAMAHGRPVVVPDEPGCREAIADGTFGFIYPLGDLDTLAARTLDAISDSTRCAGARAHVLGAYDWRVVARQIDAIYRGELPIPEDRREHLDAAARQNDR